MFCALDRHEILGTECPLTIVTFLSSIDCLFAKDSARLTMTCLLGGWMIRLPKIVHTNLSLEAKPPGVSWLGCRMLLGCWGARRTVSLSFTFVFRESSMIEMRSSVTTTYKFRKKYFADVESSRWTPLPAASGLEG